MTFYFAKRKSNRKSNRELNRRYVFTFFGVHHRAIPRYCMYPFRPLANRFLSLLDSPQHRIAVDEVAEEQQWLLLKFKVAWLMR